MDDLIWFIWLSFYVYTVMYSQRTNVNNLPTLTSLTTYILGGKERAVGIKS